MPCNCGGKPRRPATSQRPQKPVPTGNPSRPAAPPSTGRTQSFALDLANGQSLRFGSRLEADAENVRRGYTGRVRPVT